jgi:hypothetical protein
MAIVFIWFLYPPHADIINPPNTAPLLNKISFKVSRHISGPKLRATISGVKKAAGETNKKKNT